MKYYLTLFCIFCFLLIVDLLLANLFRLHDFSLSLPFLLTLAFIASQKTRFFYRGLMPLALVAGFSAELLSAVLPGTIFIAYLSASFVMLNFGRYYRKGDAWQLLALGAFVLTLMLKIIMPVVFNQIDARNLLGIILAAAQSATMTAAISALLLLFLESNMGYHLGKILFNDE